MSPTIFIFIAILGFILPSFLQVLVDRQLHTNIITGRSHCDSCKKTLQWFDLIPLFSFVFSKGRCRYCGNKISIRYFLFELIFVIGWLVLLFLFSMLSIVQLTLILGTYSVLMFMAYYDLIWFEIPVLGLLLFFAILIAQLYSVNQFSPSVIDAIISFSVILVAIASLKINKYADVGVTSLFGEADFIYFTGLGLLFGFKFVAFTFCASLLFGIFYLIYATKINNTTEENQKIPLLFISAFPVYIFWILYLTETLTYFLTF